MGIEGTIPGHHNSNTAPNWRLPAMDAVKAYLSDIRRFPMLERDQEYTPRQKRWRETGWTANAANQIVTSHLRLAAKIAMGYRGYGPADGCRSFPKAMSA